VEQRNAVSALGGSKGHRTHLRKCAVIPDVALVWETVSNISKSAVLDILLNGVEELVPGNLVACQKRIAL
jgi:hypothetical protein